MVHYSMDFELNPARRLHITWLIKLPVVLRRLVVLYPSQDLLVTILSLLDRDVVSLLTQCFSYYDIWFTDSWTCWSSGSVWYTGSGAPPSNLGVPNDYYLDTVTGDYYVKQSASGWFRTGNLTGPTWTKRCSTVPGPQGNPGTNPQVVLARRDQ